MLSFNKYIFFEIYRFYCCLLFIFIPFKLNAQSDSLKIFKLDTDEFYIKLNSTTEKLILDVRELRDFEKERIPNSISASNQQILLGFTDTVDYETPLFLYCDFISRSIDVSEILEKKGFKIIYILEDGFTGWKKKKLPIEKKKPKGNYSP